MTPLRDYQARAVGEARTALADHRSVLFVCPTGGGKTFVFAELAALFRQHGRILVLADREHLVEQAAAVIAERTSLDVGIEQGSRHINRRRMPDVVCATIQSMRQSGRLLRFKASDFALIVIDEADLGVAPSYGVVLERFPSAKVFGCTATPDRADGKSLGSVFEKTITPLYLGDLITQGFLSPMRRTLVRIESVTLADLDTKDGDYSSADLERVLTHEKALHEVVRPSIELAGTRPSIVFGATVKHAEALADIFNRYAPRSARVIHGGMKTEERRRILRAYEKGKIRFLCSCALLLRGVDLPLTSCVVMARPTQSRALYCQAIGRGTRLAPGKSDLLVLDFTDNSQTHSLISPVDILAPISEVVRERAREIIDSHDECNPQEIIEKAERELATDPELCARIQAKVNFRTSEVPDYSQKLTDKFIGMLGTMSDLKLAALVGMSQAGINKARRARGIPRFVPVKKVHTIDWTKIPLQRLSNNQVYKMYCISPNVVNEARQALGIQLVVDPQFHINGRVLTPINSINWDKIPLGTCDDRLLAAELGILARHVTKERERRGIPDYFGAINFALLPIGEVPDSVIAANYGLHPETVRKARTELGISAYRNPGGPE